MRQDLFLGTKIAIVLLAVFMHFVSAGAQAHDPQPSWNEGAAKRGILILITTAVDKGAFGFVQDRIAVFDNDGTS